MDLIELQKEIVAMIAKYGSEATVARFDSQAFLRDINRLQHANIDGKEIIIITYGGAMSKEKAIIHIKNLSKMIGSKRIKLSEGMAIHIQNEIVLALKELEEGI